MEPGALEEGLTHITISAGREKLKKDVGEDAAQILRDSLAKHVFAQMFDWLIKRINVSLGSQELEVTGFVNAK